MRNLNLYSLKSAASCMSVTLQPKLQEENATQQSGSSACACLWTILP